MIYRHPPPPSPFLILNPNIRTFSAETESIQGRAGDLVAAGTGGRAVDPVKAGGTADGTVVALETEDRVGFFPPRLLAETKLGKHARSLEESIRQRETPAENPDARVAPIDTGYGGNTTRH